jgi:hypothetical protein
MRGGSFWIKLRVALAAGFLAFMAAKDAGLPIWRDFPVGDATDFGVVTAYAAGWFLTFLERR